MDVELELNPKLFVGYKFFAVKLPHPSTSPTAFPCMVSCSGGEKGKMDWSLQKEVLGVQSCASSSERRYCHASIWVRAP